MLCGNRRVDPGHDRLPSSPCLDARTPFWPCVRGMDFVSGGNGTEAMQSTRFSAAMTTNLSDSSGGSSWRIFALQGRWSFSSQAADHPVDQHPVLVVELLLAESLRERGDSSKLLCPGRGGFSQRDTSQQSGWTGAHSYRSGHWRQAARRIGTLQLLGRGAAGAGGRRGHHQPRPQGRASHPLPGCPRVGAGVSLEDRQDLLG